ncbi:MAG: hypothetical protein JWN27_1214 [Candidatus Eremiobacteraeota bacterium]|nr:hypothetical protein [Candidatus Eremiobacteraeota bacterium]
MKRLIACVSLVAAAATAAASANTKDPPPTPRAAAHAKAVAHAKPPKCKVAPADEYFGKLKMSILGIRNVIKDQGLKVDVFPEKADSTLNSIELAEDAVHDWQHKYPCDSWLPGTIYAIEHFYGKIHTAGGVKHVHAAFAWLRHDYPKSRFVMVALREDGAAAVPAPPLAADGSPAPTPSGSPSVSN